MVADDDPNGRERAGEANAITVDGDFFVRFTKRGLIRRLARVDSSTRQADLTRMMRQTRMPQRQRNEQLVVMRINQEKRGRFSRCRWRGVRFPSRSRRSWRKSSLGIHARQRARKTIREKRFEFAERRQT